MKKHRKIFAILLLIFCLCATCAAPAYAVTEDEVQQQVDSEGKETVSGNIFIWFLCAIAFLKASQKIDSFMSSLGINVGHTGGSMLAEAMIATRGVAALRGGVGGHFSSKGGTAGGGGPGGGDGGAGGFLSGGLVGAVGRKFANGAASSVTGQGSGVTAGISRKMYESSLNKGGDFANRVTSAVAKGRAATAGTMTGPTAAAAMASYFGIRQAGAVGPAAAVADGQSDSQEYGGPTEAPDFEGSPGVGYSSPSGPSEAGIPDTPDGGTHDYSSDAADGSPAPEMGTAPHIPSYTDVEIGGGRITGVETTPEQPSGVQFAMYSAEQHSRPQGEHSTVEAVDGSKWYKQYARDTVDRTPYMDEEGEIKYHEKIVKTLPKPPSRKDRM